MIARSRETPHSLVQRTQIVLKAAAGINNKMISLELGLCGRSPLVIQATVKGIFSLLAA